MANNKITTKSYFIKRLRDCGYVVDKTPIEYLENDVRRWTILLIMEFLLFSVLVIKMELFHFMMEIDIFLIG